MMDVQTNDVDLEDGELSESSANDDVDEVYRPLQRPANLELAPSPLTTCHHLQKALDEDVDDDSQDSSSSVGSTDDCIKKLRVDGPKSMCRRKRKRRSHRTVMVRVGSTSTNDTDLQIQRARFKKYNIWTAALQEESLTETMRDCEVTRDKARDRNVENYDYALKYRLNGDNNLKRRLSNSSDDELHPAQKRGRPSSRQTEEYTQRRRSVKSRIGHRSRSRHSHNHHGTSSTSGSDNCGEARHIKDLADITGRDDVDIAREIANNLHEEKDELMVRAVQVLGVGLPIEIYKETQRIELDGGMMIKNGRRRRTPGGVFLFLLKNNDTLTPEQQRSIFTENRQTGSKTRKQMESMMRDRKVEELKKRLSEQQRNELPTLHTRKEHFLLGTELNVVEHQTTNLSNPPPSPVGLEQSSPEYKTHAINDVGTDNSEGPTTSAAAAAAHAARLNNLKTDKILVSYDDDFLDVNCGEMDLF